ncbi:conserved oligomeric Golgi complex subunit 1 [Phalaenopsis equestris]|uniref:conserved oligomeric Golgi complex subunit 1 n=1 Tax=Phalaenopsis equestris TaxID=78828 RepID=UPI0009E27E73|nr:conserved oligomeric Golgi complex subunit 1 [Phalaenopsis equestris]
MRMPTRPPADSPATPTALSLRDAESLFRSKRIHEIRAVEAATRRDIEQKKEELRQLVGKSYRDLIDSADSIIQMKSSCESIYSNLSLIDAALRSLSPSTTDSPHTAPDPARFKIYGIACRVKYLVDTPENIWGCLDESMLLEASGRYLRAKEVHGLISSVAADSDVLSLFPLLQHQWQIVESFTSQISQRSRDRLMDRGLTVAAYADALAAAATIDDLNPKQVLDIFLDSRRAWISQKLVSPAADGRPNSFTAVLCDVAGIIRSSLGQVGQLLRHALNEMPLFYKMVLGSPPGSQLFGGIPNPEEEVKLWKSHREKLESVMVLLEPEFVSQACSSWLQGCCDEIFAGSSNGKVIIQNISGGEGLVAAEKMVREALNGREGLEDSLEEWLRGVFGSDIKSPWKQICGLMLKDGKDIFEDKMELLRMKEIVQSGFEDLTKEVSLRDSVVAIVSGPNGAKDFYEYLKKSSKGGGVWFSELNQRRTGLAQNFKPAADENDFRSCLNAYFGPEVSRIRDLIDKRLCSILDDLLCFIESHNSAIRLKELAPHIQNKCYKAMSALLGEIKEEMGGLSVSLVDKRMDNDSQPPPVIVERTLFLGRLLYALQYHSSHIPIILGSPRLWVKETTGSAYTSLASPLSKQSKETLNSPISFSPRRPSFDSPPSPGRHSLESHRRQVFSAAAALFTVDSRANLKHEELSRKLQDLCIRAHSLWITWVSNELSIILSSNLNHDDALSVTNPLRGWEVTVIRQEEPTDGHLEMQIALPSMASQYIISFLFQACQEIHKVGGHVLDKVILQNFAFEMLKKVIVVYENLLAKVEAPESHISEKGILQIMLDLRFCADVLSGGKDTNSISDEFLPARRKLVLQPDSSIMELVSRLIQRFSQRLDPIDWATYEPYLWENEKQSYKRSSVLFGFFIQLDRLYIDTVQKLPTKSNTESNILRCSTVPRFKYLPISAPALSSRGVHKSVLQTTIDVASSKSPWSTYSNGERSPKSDFDDSSSFGAATPLLKSLMTQVGSKFGESTSRWGLMLSDGQVGKLKDKSAAAMSTFGDMLPGPAAGLLSSLTSTASRFDSL